MSDKLEKLKEMLKLLQDDTVKPSTIKQFLELVLNTIKKSKENFESLSKDNLQEIDKALERISTEHSDVLDRVSKENNSTKKEVETKLQKSIRQMREMCEELMLAKPQDGADGIDGNDGKDGKDGSPDTRLEIVEKINKGRKKDLKIELEQIEGTAKFEKGILDRAIGILDQRTQFLINKNVAHDGTLSGTGSSSDPLSVTLALDDLTDVIAENPSPGQALVWNGANWVNDNVSGSGGGSTWFFDQTPTDGGTYTLLQGSIDGANQTFTVSEGQYISGSLIVILNGQVLSQGSGSNEWVEASFLTGTFTLNTAPSGTDEVQAFYTTTAGGGGGNAAGADTEVQFNGSGVLAVDPTFTFDKINNILTVENLTLTGALTLPDDIRQTFNPGVTVAGLNVGSLAGDPSTPINGDLWYDSSANELTARINGANVALGAGGGGSGITIGTTTITSGTDTRILYNNAGVAGEYTISGTGNVAMTSSPVFTTPNIGLANTNDGLKFGTNTGPVFYSDSGFATPLGSLNFSSDGVFSLDSGTGGHNARFDFTGVTGTKTYTLPDATGTVALTSVDTLASLTSIQGFTVTLADAGADAILGWDDSAGAYENLTQAEVLAVIGSASTTAQGVVELAIASETTTGTSATLAVTPDGLAGSDYGKRVVNILVSDPTGSAITTGDGKACFRVPSVMNGWNLVGVAGSLSTVSSSGLPTFQVRRSRRSTATTRTDADMLSTKLSIDASEFDSVDATTAVVIDGSNDDVNTGDNIYIDIDVAGTGAKGLVAELIFQLP